MKQTSLFWEHEESYKEWLAAIRNKENEYIQDLNLDLIYDELDRMSEFGSLDCEKVFMHPCTRDTTIRYRQNIMDELYRNTKLCEILKEFVSDIKGFRKKYVQMMKIQDEGKKKIYSLQIASRVQEQLQQYHRKLIVHIHKDDSLSVLIEMLSDYVQRDEIKEVRKSLSEYLHQLKNAYSFSLIFNKSNQQAVGSATINHEFIGDGEDYSSKIEQNAKYFFDEYDFSISAYQDTDITSLDKRLQMYSLSSFPDLIQDTELLYEKYNGITLDEFTEVADELAFYLTYIKFMILYEEQGFYFTKPIISKQDNYSRVQGAYDLSLAINQYRRTRKNEVVSNHYEFNERDNFFVLTGANQGGKTTYLRSIGIIQSLFQIGVFVPAQSASLCIVNRLHIHFSKEDMKSSNVGKFEQELQSIQRILTNVNNKDMILLNEPFTSTQRSVAIVLLKVLLLEFAKLNCIGGLVTHYYEVFNELPTKYFYSLVTRVSKDQINHRRTFQIIKTEAENNSYAHDIAMKCGVTYEQLVNIMNAKEGKDV